MNATPSILTKFQEKNFHKKSTVKHPDGITAFVRYDDRCGNGHNTFSITGETRNSGGCIHEEIAERFPDLAPLIKWHLCSSDGPLHYLENTIYHAKEHGPTHAWVYFVPQSSSDLDPLQLQEMKESMIGYLDAEKAKKAESHPSKCYRVKWDEKTAKIRNLDHARSSAIWPDATDDELTAPGLKERLQARLPKLLADFRAAVESLGFTW